MWSVYLRERIDSMHQLKPAAFILYIREIALYMYICLIELDMCPKEMDGPARYVHGQKCGQMTT